MNAKDNRKKAENFLIKRDISQLNSIIESISLKASKGEFEQFVYSNIYDNVKKSLEDIGYTVTRDSNDRDGEVTYKITW